MIFVVSCYGTHRDPHSFPTRRSSDLEAGLAFPKAGELVGAVPDRGGVTEVTNLLTGEVIGRWRSEEHTSELQSHSDLVCRLLLEKKKRQQSTRELAAPLG